jgi:hypothetical protein
LAEQDREYIAGRAWFRAGLALTLSALAVHEEARTNMKSALNTFAEIDAPYEALDALMICGQILVDEGKQLEKAAQLLAFVEHNSIENYLLQQWAHDLSKRLPILPTELEAAVNVGRSMGLNEALVLAIS